MINQKNLINTHFLEHINSLKKIQEKPFIDNIILASKIISKALKNKKTVFWCGNGGSASDSMHLSAELLGRFKKNRRPLKSISLTGNPASLTCISNDFGYLNIFSRQIEGLGNNGDVLVAISTSGNSKNIIKAINQAKKKKLYVISFLGNNGGLCKGKSDLDLIVKSKSTARIQEMHIFIGHVLCDLIEKKMKLSK
jgi:D-sedoheptulose 7-phosphate isomerase